MNQKGNLIFFCGEMGAGKTTTSKTIAREKNAVLISEDEWLSAHYPNEINSFDDYLAYSSRIKAFVMLHVQSILKTGTDVVIDFPANTINQRGWFKQLCNEIECNHELIYLDLSNEECLLQIAKRRHEHPERAQFDNEAVFYHVTNFFEPPSENEGLKIVQKSSGL
ncbi:ATP-binding protein [Methylophilus sp. Leaf414]|uniref:AAA family ATPase n=1 Tax=Methylophilus sp. Leaf414 TaxID=1736371 RepID=UPI0009EA0845|nr:ATP-binding protein [Methylophilus sp. Leaf414]